MTAGLVGGEAFSVDASFIKADVNQTKRVPGDRPIDWPDREKASRAVAEYLGVLDQESDGENKGGPEKKPPKALSLTDPQAAWVAKRKTRPIFAYDANYLIDNKLGVIVDAEGTRANRSDEHDAAKTMIDRARQRLGLRPRRLAADTAYGATPVLKWLMDRGIEPHIPVWDKSRRADGTFSRPDFTYDKGRDIYICPGGKTLKTTGQVVARQNLVHRRNPGYPVIGRIASRPCERCSSCSS